MHKLCAFIMFLGRICLSAIFIFAGLSKFMNYDASAAFMESKGMTMIPFFLYVAAIIELLGGLSLILGYKTKCGAGLLVLFLIPVTFVFHDFWNISGDAQQAEMIHFLSNLAIIGGLLHVLCCGCCGIGFDKAKCPYPCD